MDSYPRKTTMKIMQATPKERSADPNSLLLNEREAARLLNISPRTLWSLRAAGKIRYVRIAATGIRYARTDLVKFIETQTVIGE